jgi:hypothetical protein
LRLICLVLKHFIKISDKLSAPDFRETSAKEMPHCAAIKGASSNHPTRSRGVWILSSTGPKEHIMTASTKTRRWMDTALEQSRDRQPAMPWARGTRRAEMITRRAPAAQDTQKRSA